MKNGEDLQVAFPSSRRAWHRQCVQEPDIANGSMHKHCRQMRPSAFVMARTLLVNFVIWQPIFPSVVFPSSAVFGCRLEQRGQHFCMCLHIWVHVSPTSPLLPTQADHFHVKWAVTNCVISLHQLYPDKSTKSNTKKKGLALETSVKAILNHRSN